MNPERGRQELIGARQALADAIGRLRQQIFALRPVTLEETGLGPTLRRYLGTLPGSVELIDELGGARLDPKVEIALFRIAQAALGRPPAASSIRLTKQGLTVQGAAKPDMDEARLWAEHIGAQLNASEGAIALVL